jgi:hypothetical protein
VLLVLTVAATDDDCVTGVLVRTPSIRLSSVSTASASAWNCAGPFGGSVSDGYGSP